MAISGSLAGQDSMPMETPASSTICGSSTRQPANGHGWAEAAQYRYPPAALAASRAFTAPAEYRQRQTPPGAGKPGVVGPTAAATCGFLAVAVSMPREIPAFSTTSLNSPLPPANGPGYAEATRLATRAWRPNPAATWGHKLPDMSPAAAPIPSVGPEKTASYGSLEAAVAGSRLTS